MKKAISLLVVIMLLSSILVGCNVSDFWNDIIPTNTTADTTINEEPESIDPSTLTINHGDNFTEEDIEFVRSLHNYRKMYYTPKIFTFSKMVEDVRQGEGYLYFLDVDMENSYYICGYLDISIEENLYEWAGGIIDVESYAWFKFEDRESIPEQIDNMNICWTAHIYDAVIVADVGNNTKCNQKTKFYSLGFEDGGDVRIVYKHMIIHHYCSLDETQYIQESIGTQRYYDGYITTQGDYYFVLKYRSVIKENGNEIDGVEDNRQQLEEYYDILFPYFERLTEMDGPFITTTGEEITLLYYGISIDALYDVLFRK